MGLAYGCVSKYLRSVRLFVEQADTRAALKHYH